MSSIELITLLQNITKSKEYINLRKILTSVMQHETKTLITGSEDGYIKLLDYKAMKAKRMFNLCNFPITSMTLLNPGNLVAVN